MARIRQIKPVFFLDEDLANCCLEARLLYIGLWTIADREGILENRPARIKAQIFPYDDKITRDKIQKWLEELSAGRFIIPYSVDGKSLLWIRTFTQHQHCHSKEQPSQLPQPTEDIKKPGASPVQVREMHHTSPSTSTSTYGIRHTDSGYRSKYRKTQKTGTPDEFDISQNLREWAEKKEIDIDLKLETEKFLDYHRAKGNSFANWDAAWKNWMRNAKSFGAKPKTDSTTLEDLVRQEQGVMSK